MLVFKFEVVEADDVAVLNAHLLKAGKEAALAQHLVEIHPALVVGEVDVRHQSLEPRAFDDVGVVVHRDVERGGGVELRRALCSFKQPLTFFLTVS